MARPKTSNPRPYGRQGKGKTIKSLSIESEVLLHAEKEAEKRGMNFSEYINALLKGTLLLVAGSFLAMHLWRSPSKWSAASLAKTANVILTAMR